METRLVRSCLFFAPKSHQLVAFFRGLKHNFLFSILSIITQKGYIFEVTNWWLFDSFGLLKKCFIIVVVRDLKIEKEQKTHHLVTFKTLSSLIYYI